MLNSFEELKIEDNLTLEQIIEKLENKRNELEKLKSIYEPILDASFKRGITGLRDPEFNNGGESIEEILNERHVLQLEKDKKYFSQEEIEKLINDIEELSFKKSKDVRAQVRMLKNVLLNQYNNLRSNYETYISVLKNYKSNPQSDEYKVDIFNIYIRDKFEEEVIKISESISCPFPLKPEKNFDFFLYTY